MIRKAIQGRKVRIHYAKKKQPFVTHEGVTGIMVTGADVGAKGPHNALVEISSGLVVAPFGNLFLEGGR